MSAVTTEPSRSDDRRGLESLLSFWADAGVDALYADEPVDRTRRVEVTARAPASPAASPASSTIASTPSIDVDAPRRVADQASDLDSLRAAATEYLRQACRHPVSSVLAGGGGRCGPNHWRSTGT